MGIQAQTATAVRGPKWNLSSRDQQMPPLTGVAGRADRAFDNFKESFPWFLAAVFLVLQLGRTGQLSAIGSYMYLGGRFLYLPCYLFNIVFVRTIFYSVALLGIVLILVQAFIG